MISILRQFKESQILDIRFILNILRNILSNLEEESHMILKHIIRINKINAQNLEIGEKFMDHGASEEDMMEKRIILEISKALDEHYQKRIKEEMSPLEREQIEKAYQKDIFLTFHRLQTHIRDADGEIVNLTDLFQFIDRIRQKIEHIHTILSKNLEVIDQLDFSDPSALEPFLRQKREYLKEYAEILTMHEERLVFEKTYGIKIAENTCHDHYEDF